MSLELVFETHQTTLDNEAGIATGWLPGRLSDLGRRQARELGERRRDDGLAAVFSSDLHRAVESVDLAFGDEGPPVLLDWRLRECDYGELNGAPRDQVHADRVAHLSTPYPGGESWQQAVDRVGSFLGDLLPRWDGARVLVVGHVATRLGLDHFLLGVPLVAHWRRSSLAAGVGVHARAPGRFAGMSTWTTPERPEPPNNPVDERAALEDRLDFQRTTLLLKCGGLTPEQLALRSVPPSTISLLGLVRHLSAVEAWFHGYDGQPDHAFFHNYVPNANNSFEDVDVARATDDLASYHASVARSRAAVPGATSARRCPGRTTPCGGSTCT